MGKIISFVNIKGNCGKTTTVCSIGQIWASIGKRVLLVDLDPQADLTATITGSDQEKVWDMTIEDAFAGGKEIGLPIEHVSENVDLVPADLELCNFERDTSIQSGRESILKGLVEDVRDRYDFILIDCPPTLGIVTLNALVASDYMVMVGNSDGKSFKGMEMTSSLFSTVMDNLNYDIEFAGVIITRYERNEVSERYRKKMKEKFRYMIIEPAVRKSAKLAQSPSIRKNILEYDPEGKATKDYRQVAQELYRRVVLD